MKVHEIKLIKIGETYIKFDFEFTEGNKELIKKAYLQQIGYSSKDFLKYQELLKISIEFDKGSLKTRIVLWGAAIYMGIGYYGSFRAGVREIVNNVTTFSEYVIERIDNDPDINPNNIIRSERRTGLPGRFQKLYERIGKLEINLNNLSNNEIEQELNEIRQDVANLSAVLPIQDKQSFIEELDEKYCQNLPDPNERRTDYLLNRYFLKTEENVEFIQ